MTKEENPYHWRVNTKDDQIELIISEQVLGVIIGWKDRKTGEHCGFTSTITLKNGEKKHLNFQSDCYNSVESAKKATLSAIAEHYENIVNLSPDIKTGLIISTPEQPNITTKQPQKPAPLLTAITSILTLAGIPDDEHAKTLQALAADMTATLTP